MLHTQGFQLVCDVYFVHSMEPLAIKDAVAAASTRGIKNTSSGHFEFQRTPPNFIGRHFASSGEVILDTLIVNR